MNIVLVNTLYAPHFFGGAEKSVQELAEGLESRGHKVQVVTLDAVDSLLPQHEQVNGVNIYRLQSKGFAPFVSGWKNASSRRKLIWHLQEAWRPSSRRAIKRLLARINPDVVHYHNVAGFGASIFAATGRIPRIFTARDYYAICAKSNLMRNGTQCSGKCLDCAIMTLPRRRALRDVTAITSVSKYTLDKIQQYSSINSLRRVIYNRPKLHSAPADVNDASRSNRAKSGNAPVRLGYLGQVSREKGALIAAEVLSKLPRGAFSLSMGGTGDPGFLDEVRMCAGNNASDLHLLGHVGANDFLSNVDILLVPSQWPDPFNRTVFEGAVAGCQVLASSIGGLPEASKLAGCQVVHDFARADAWAQAILTTKPRPRIGRAVSVIPDPVLEYEHLYVELIGEYSQQERL